ncbi:MAG TPA: LuxR C-terminal-related transcriptional regulator [Chloroflexota bacterium]|nr:LuxR C-terminal-related transcriptional regulator [Chloroflexota bacterium]
MSGASGPPGPEARALILPAGTVTFLVADLDRSAECGVAPAAGAWREPLVQAVDAAVGVHGGWRCEPGRVDDKLVAVFDTAAAAVAAALHLRAVVWERAELRPLRDGLRMGLHTGDARVREDGRYLGAAVRTSEGLAEIAHGGQTLVSAPAAAALAGQLPSGSSLVDLGLHRLRDLSSPLRVFELARGQRVTDRTPLKSLDTVPNSLPVQLTGFVGRRAERAAVGALLRDERLVTLTGVGGAGKTRLAAQVAADQAERWPDGVRWVELGTITEAGEVAPEVAAATGVLVEPVRGALRSMTLQLQERRLLICLDNCEQVLEGAAGVAEALLRACPEVTVLATSREPLGVPGEAVWRVPPLTEEDALALFVERGSLVRPWFTLDASSEAAVRTMCARLDGIPLALELAAAWLGALTPQQIEAGLDDRFALLVRGPRGAIPRQQTLAASMDWSHALLEEPQRIVFRRLAVFPGGFDLEAARAVAAGASAGGTVARADVLGALGRLVDKSLVLAEPHHGEVRYRLLETIRQYAAERLEEAGETEATRDRHLDHFLALAEGMEPERLRDMDAWRTRLELEHDNLRAALEWGLSAPEPARGRRLAATLPWLWHLHGRHGHEGLGYLWRAARRAPHDRSTLQAQLLAGIALVADTARPLDLEFDAAQQALEIANERGDDRLRALCLALSAVGQFYTDFDAAWKLTVEGVDTAERTGDTFMADATRGLQGIILHLRDRHDAAEELMQPAVENLLRRHRGIAATILGYQACGALYTGQLERARQLAGQAVRVAEPLGDYHRMGSTRSVLALVLGLTGETEAGLEVLRPALRLVEGGGDEVFVPGLAWTMGVLHLRRGEPEPAAAWLEREARSTDRGTETWLAAQSLPWLGAARAALGQIEEARGALERAMAVARRLGMPRVVAEALEQEAYLAAGDGDDERATDLHHEALALRTDHGLRTFYVDSLDALAALGARVEPAGAAVRLLAASDAAREAMGYPRAPEQELAHGATLNGLRAALGEQPFAAAWAEGTRLTLDEAVAYVRRRRGARRRPSTGWGSLTPTELDVVRLVVAGLTNPQIGSRLFMSRGTVKTHLAHVYTKLGVANRTELATLATPRLAPARPAPTTRS